MGELSQQSANVDAITKPKVEVLVNAKTKVKTKAAARALR